MTGRAQPRTRRLGGAKGIRTPCMQGTGQPDNILYFCTITFMVSPAKSTRVHARAGRLRYFPAVLLGPFVGDLGGLDLTTRIRTGL